MEEQRAQLMDAIDALVRSAEMFHPRVILGEPVELERLGLTEKVAEVRNKWLERCSDILSQLGELRQRCQEPVLAQKLDDAIKRLEEMRQSLV